MSLHLHVSIHSTLAFSIPLYLYPFLHQVLLNTLSFHFTGKIPLTPAAFTPLLQNPLSFHLFLFSLYNQTTTGCCIQPSPPNPQFVPSHLIDITKISHNSTAYAIYSVRPQASLTQLISTSRVSDLHSMYVSYLHMLMLAILYYHTAVVQ